MSEVKERLTEVREEHLLFIASAALRAALQNVGVSAEADKIAFISVGILLGV